MHLVWNLQFFSLIYLVFTSSFLRFATSCLKSKFSEDRIPIISLNLLIFSSYKEAIIIYFLHSTSSSVMCYFKKSNSNELDAVSLIIMVNNITCTEKMFNVTW
jgi:hypothetical protein